MIYSLLRCDLFQQFFHNEFLHVSFYASIRVLRSVVHPCFAKRGPTINFSRRLPGRVLMPQSVVVAPGERGQQLIQLGPSPRGSLRINGRRMINGSEGL